MPFNCPKCSAEIDAIGGAAFKERIAELTAAKDAAETARAQATAALESANATAGRLSARIAGFEHDDDALSILRDRHQKSGHKADFTAWLTADDGAKADRIASKLVPAPAAVAVAPTTPPPATTAPQAPTTPPAPTVTASATVAPGPATTPRMTPEQVTALNAPLKAEYARAKTPEEKASIRAKMEQNWSLAG